MAQTNYSFLSDEEKAKLLMQPSFGDVNLMAKESQPRIEDQNQAAMLEQMRAQALAEQEAQAQQQAQAMFEQQQAQQPVGLKQRLMQQLEGLSQQDLSQQQQAIEEYGREIESFEQQPQKYDLRPLANLIDQYYGTNTFRVAQQMAPPSVETRQEQLKSMKSALRGMKAGLTKSQAELLQRQLDMVLSQEKLLSQDKALEKKLSSAEERARILAAQKQAQPTAGLKAADVAAGKEYSDYIAGGGSETINKNISLLQSAISDLAEPEEISGGISGLTGEATQDIINPKGAAVRDKIRSAIQGTLRQILGGQFTEKEATAMFNRAYNPRLSDQENIRRATVELNTLRNMALKKQQSMQYFEQTGGTLKGFKGTEKKSEPSMMAQPQQQPGGLSEEKRKRLEELRAKKAAGGL